MPSGLEILLMQMCQSRNWDDVCSLLSLTMDSPALVLYSVKYNETGN